MANSNFKGWANYHTWNVAKAIQESDELTEFAQGCDDYEEFVEGCGEVLTPDGVSFTDPTLDIAELDEMILDL